MSWLAGYDRQRVRQLNGTLNQEPMALPVI
jgi:hypothetical protein